MDPVTLIVGALAAGGGIVAAEATKLVVKDAYQSLKNKISKRFKERKVEGAELVLKQHAEKPDVWEKPLKDMLVQADVQADEQIVYAAQKLMELIKPGQVQIGKVNIKADNIGSVTHADNIENLNQYINSPSGKK